MIIKAKMKDGSPVIIHHEDKGDSVPGFDSSGNRFKAYTSRFWSDKFPEMYVQVDADIANSKIRMAEDYAHLEAAGVDTSTIEINP